MVGQGEETICIHGVLIMCEPQCHDHDHHYNYHYLCLYHHRRHHYEFEKSKSPLLSHLKVSEHQIGLRPDRTTLCNWEQNCQKRNTRLVNRLKIAKCQLTLFVDLRWMEIAN